MAYEFKSLGTVDVVETVTDTANVLIEEDGMIKRAPKSEVGGAKNVEPDMLIEIIPSSAMLDKITTNDVIIKTGNVGQIIDMVNAGSIPNVEVAFHQVRPYYYGCCTRVRPILQVYDDQLWITFPVCYGYNASTSNMLLRVRMYDDGSISSIQKITLSATSTDLPV